MNENVLFENKTCIKGCCNYITSNFTTYKTKNHKDSNKKGGALIYDYKTRKVLLVQSRGNLWGIPKGTFENDENSIDCTIREVEEETGIKIPRIFFDEIDKYSCLNIYGNGFYYFYPIKEIIVKPFTNMDNDVNAIGWFKLRCLHEMINNGKIKLNVHTKKCFKYFLGIKFKTF